MTAFPSKLHALLRACYEYWVLFSCLLFFGLGGLAFTVVGSLLALVIPKARARRLGRRTMQVLFRSFTGFLAVSRLVHVDVRAVAALRHERGLIIAPNHISLCDAVFLISRLPNVVCIIKAKIWDNPVLAGGARLAGYIRNDAPGSMVKQAVAELRAGAHLLIFPEGTRTVRPPVNPFRGGCALIARQANVPVQTVLLRANAPLLGKSDPLFKRPRFPVRYQARLGERLAIGQHESTREFLHRLEAYYAEALRPNDSPTHADG